MKLLLKAEDLSMLVVCLFCFFYVFNFSFTTLLLLLFIPDLSMIGYLVNTNIGSKVYNLIHHLFLPLLMFMISFLINNETIRMVSLIWLIHIFMDRSLGFGLKYPDSFKHTHLSN